MLWIAWWVNMCMEQRITPNGPAAFIIQWFGENGLPHPNSQLRINFNPVLSAIGAIPGQTRVSLLHWQAKPFGYRRWGAYCCATNTYYSHTSIDVRAVPRTIQVDEFAVPTIPTAMLYFPETQVYILGPNQYQIRN